MKQGKCFLFHFESAFRFWDLTFQLFKCNDVIKYLSMKHKTLNNLESKQSGNEIWPVYVILQKKKNYRKILRKMWPGN